MGLTFNGGLKAPNGSKFGIIGRDARVPIPQDTTPDGVVFASDLDLTQGQSITSQSVILGDFDGTLAASVDVGILFINGISSGTSGNVVAGDSVSINLTASSTYGITIISTLHVGIHDIGTYTISTFQPDHIPNAFTIGTITFPASARGTWAYSPIYQINGLAPGYAVRMSAQYPSSVGNFQLVPSPSKSITTKNGYSYYATNPANSGGGAGSFRLRYLLPSSATSVTHFVKTTHTNGTGGTYTSETFNVVVE